MLFFCEFIQKINEREKEDEQEISRRHRVFSKNKLIVNSNQLGKIQRI